MCKVIVVTNRKLCSIDFLMQLEKIAAAKPYGIILREKDLTETEYEELAAKVLEICKGYEVKCILHTYVHVARNLGCRAIHLPFPVLKNEAWNLKEFDIVGTSVHTTLEAKEAEKLGVSYLTAGHIFATDCKKGLAPKGIPFLMNLRNEVCKPVYAIGGINPDNAYEAVEAGAKGVCVMSGFMKCEKPSEYLSLFYKLQPN
ncbi:MAG: thiamine phosphate synthase [Clostridiales bacterium]|nr:thiamine phosphate synthase [Clostridiales bacterium]